MPCIKAVIPHLVRDPLIVEARNESNIDTGYFVSTIPA